MSPELSLAVALRDRSESVAEISMIQIVPLSRHLDAQRSAKAGLTHGASSIHSRLDCRA